MSMSLLPPLELESLMHASPFQELPRSFSSDSTYPLFEVLLSVAATILITQYRRILWPRSQADRSFSEPIPPGGLGCPYFGRDVIGEDKKSGRGSTWRKIWLSLGKPKVFKSYFMGSPMAVVSGSKNISAVLNSEFRSPGVATLASLNKTGSSLFAASSLRNASDKKGHSFLRRLVGQAMTPAAVSKAVPLLQQAATYHVTKLLESPTTKMLDVCNTFTLDVACKQIIGLKINETEVETFRKAVNDWTEGVFSPINSFLPGSRLTAYKARNYLEKLIEAKIEDLEHSGPDGSTLSAMVYATDESTGTRLTQKQLIDNVLLLIAAGSETSANTLTTAMLLLGLYSDVFVKIKEEQKHLISKYGENLTKTQLDNECPYLTAVIKETMRIKPVSAAIRIAKDTIVVDGKQIPKGWRILSSIQITHMNDPVTFEEDGSHMDIMKGFKPERWLNKKTRPTTEFKPFGYGYRHCLGANLAMAEMKIFLAMIARHIDFDLVGNKDLIEWNSSTVVPTPEDGTVIAPRASSNNSSVLSAVAAVNHS